MDFLKKKELKENQRGGRFADAKKIEVLYCAKQKIKSLESFDDFKNLKFLWLNGNKLRHLGMSLRSNTFLVELYLHDNNIYSVTGCLQHLTVLQVLLLHNNFLADLPALLHEFRNMYRLETLNEIYLENSKNIIPRYHPDSTHYVDLFHNPVAFEPNYQIKVISNLTSLKIFDRNEVTTLAERAKWRKKSQPNVLTDLQRTPNVFKQQQQQQQQQRQQVKSKSSHGHNSHCLSQDKGEVEGEKMEATRTSNNSVLIYNNFNWKRIPFMKDKRTMKGKFKVESINHLYQ